MRTWDALSSTFLTWVHFGDLHIRDEQDDNYLDFLDLIDHANAHLLGEVDFAFLPGDNADDGSELQYKLVRKALDRLQLPVHTIPGDHDRKSGSLDLFRRYLQADLYRAIDLGQFRLLFLNAMDGETVDTFDFSAEQFNWLKAQLFEARANGLRPLVFTHLYPSELLTREEMFGHLLREFQVLLVEMGHTHYNELANDGHTIYVTTRSTGQIEEGLPGFSFTAIDDNVVSWKFKELGSWPFVMITSPADERLITRPESANQVVRGTIPIRAKIWGSNATKVFCAIDDGPEQAMSYTGGRWTIEWNSASVSDGSHRILVQATGATIGARDEISVLVNQAGLYIPPTRNAIDYENSIGAYPEKCILGTQLGPNENGTKGPWPSWRSKPYQLDHLPK